MTQSTPPVNMLNAMYLGGREKMTGIEFQNQVMKEAGFLLFAPTVPGYGETRIPAGVIFVCDLNGNIIREAAEDDVRKWNDIWNRLAHEAFNAKAKAGHE